MRTGKLPQQSGAVMNSGVWQLRQKVSVAGEQMTTGNTNLVYAGTSSGNVYKGGQSFTVSKTDAITGVQLKLYQKFGTPTNGVTVRIETSSSGLPTGTLANANAATTATPGADGAWFTATFSTPFSLSTGTTYCIVVSSTDTQSNGNYWALTGDTPSKYANGVALSFNVSWSEVTGYDLCFVLNTTTGPVQNVLLNGLDEYTRLMLHLDGADAATSTVDSATLKAVTFVGTAQLDALNNNRTITYGGSAQLDTAQKVFGLSSMLFNGSTDYITMPSSTDFAFGTGDYTIDFRARFNAFGTEDGGWNCMYSATDANQIVISYWSGTGTKGIKIWMPGQADWRTFAWTASTATWYHIAVCRQGTSLKVFIDGTQIGSTESSSNNVGQSGLTLGRQGNAIYYFNGWLDELRVVKGEALFTANFTSTTEAYKAPYGKAVLMMHFDGADASTPANGDSSIVKFGNASLFLDGNSDSLSFADSEDFNFGSGDFTIDTWIRFNALQDCSILISQIGTTESPLVLLYKVATDKFQLLASADDSTYFVNELSSVLGLSTGAWYHIALVRSGTSWKVYLNGTSVLSTTASGTIFNASNTVYIGNWVGGNWFNGWIDEFRVSKGIARWTTDFTPPTQNYGINGNDDVEYKLKYRYIGGHDGNSTANCYPNGSTSQAGGIQTIGGWNTAVASSQQTFAGAMCLQWNVYVVKDTIYTCEFVFAAKTGQYRQCRGSVGEQISGTTVTATNLMAISYNESLTPITLFLNRGGHSDTFGIGSEFEIYSRRSTL